MNFGFTEDQDMIRKSARDFVQRESSLERVRALREDDRGWSLDLWRRIAEQGWLGAVFPEEYGGIGLGYVDLICIAEEFGRGLMPEPLITSAVLAGNVVYLGGNEEQKSALLPGVCDGSLLLTLAAYELPGRFDLAHVETTGRPSNGGYILNGAKHFVADAGVADKVLISARTSGSAADSDGVSVFVLDRETPGLTVTPISTVDRRRRATITLENVVAGPDALLGGLGEGYGVLEDAVDRATVALCAEMVGAMEEALRRAVEYSHQRVQFGRPIGSFQALKHKAANMYVNVEMARSSMYYAAMALDEARDDARAAMSAAKAFCSDAFLAVSKDAIQMHGGIGYTDEHDIHFFYKRAVASNVMFGDAAYHRERYTREKGLAPAASRAYEPASR